MDRLHSRWWSCRALTSEGQVSSRTIKTFPHKNIGWHGYGRDDHSSLRGKELMRNNLLNVSRLRAVRWISMPESICKSPSLTQSLSLIQPLLLIHPLLLNHPLQSNHPLQFNHHLPFNHPVHFSRSLQSIPPFHLNHPLYLIYTSHAL